MSTRLLIHCEDQCKTLKRRKLSPVYHYVYIEIILKSVTFIDKVSHPFEFLITPFPKSKSNQKTRPQVEERQ